MSTKKTEKTRSIDVNQRALRLHEKCQGKYEIVSKVPLRRAEDLTLAYTPGVAAPCLEIEKHPEMIYDYTTKGNMVAVVTNGTAVLGLGNIGAGAGLPVMEGKAILFKGFAGVDAVPICLNTQDVDEVVRTVELMAPSFGGINLEDIKAPQCFDIETRLREKLDIPVFHDDQHGTAIVTAAGLLNAVKVTGKKMGELKIVMSGAGAAGLAIATLLTHMGFGNVILCDRKGAIYEGRDGLNPYKQRVAKITNKDHEAGSLADVLVGADAFLGVSKPGLVTPQMVSTMKDGIVFAMANPTPEIMPDEAKAGGAKVVATGRSDFPNQINNVLVFPGIFKGALAARAPQITEEMEIAAAEAIASLVPEDKLSPDFIIPSALDKTVADVVAKAVADRVKK
ncbi:malic enzyme-like NAD(P)-binding protein [Parafannyhessea umbonata]|uniref:NAD(P)-dependent malic enzyme n=2 Tax=Parafannyhessea umbonata TaxID=604330 RepID=UPI002A806274|nr:malic enzyme-like NAD(P)-binding protein [Parafannyhessea umbonata]MDY4417656.1 malic enzyme-like NAD(P)-binding protein [Parafannyhessea umbonata]